MVTSSGCFSAQPVIYSPIKQGVRKFCVGVLLLTYILWLTAASEALAFDPDHSRSYFVSDEMQLNLDSHADVPSLCFSTEELAQQSINLEPDNTYINMPTVIADHANANQFFYQCMHSSAPNLPASFNTGSLDKSNDFTANDGSASYNESSQSHLTNEEALSVLLAMNDSHNDFAQTTTLHNSTAPQNSTDFIPDQQALRVNDATASLHANAASSQRANNSVDTLIESVEPKEAGDKLTENTELKESVKSLIEAVEYKESAVAAANDNAVASIENNVTDLTQDRAQSAKWNAATDNQSANFDQSKSNFSVSSATALSKHEKCIQDLLDYESSMDFAKISLKNKSHFLFLNNLQFFIHMMPISYKKHHHYFSSEQICLSFISSIIRQNNPYQVYTESISQALRINATNAEVSRQVIELYKDVLKEQIYLDITSYRRKPDYVDNESRFFGVDTQYQPLGFAKLRPPFSIKPADSNSVQSLADKEQIEYRRLYEHYYYTHKKLFQGQQKIPVLFDVLSIDKAFVCGFHAPVLLPGMPEVNNNAVVSVTNSQLATIKPVDAPLNTFSAKLAHADNSSYQAQSNNLATPSNLALDNAASQNQFDNSATPSKLANLSIQDSVDSSSINDAITSQNITVYNQDSANTSASANNVVYINKIAPVESKSNANSQNSQTTYEPVSVVSINSDELEIYAENKDSQLPKKSYYSGSQQNLHQSTVHISLLEPQVTTADATIQTSKQTSKGESTQSLQPDTTHSTTKDQSLPAQFDEIYNTSREQQAVQVQQSQTSLQDAQSQADTQSSQSQKSQQISYKQHSQLSGDQVKPSLIEQHTAQLVAQNKHSTKETADNSSSPSAADEPSKDSKTSSSNIYSNTAPIPVGDSDCILHRNLTSEQMTKELIDLQLPQFFQNHQLSDLKHYSSDKSYYAKAYLLDESNLSINQNKALAASEDNSKLINKFSASNKQPQNSESRRLPLPTIMSTNDIHNGVATPTNAVTTSSVTSAHSNVDSIHSSIDSAYSDVDSIHSSIDLASSVDSIHSSVNSEENIIANILSLIDLSEQAENGIKVETANQPYLEEQHNQDLSWQEAFNITLQIFNLESQNTANYADKIANANKFGKEGVSSMANSTVHAPFSEHTSTSIKALPTLSDNVLTVPTDKNLGLSADNDLVSSADSDLANPLLPVYAQAANDQELASSLHYNVSNLAETPSLPTYAPKIKILLHHKKCSVDNAPQLFSFDSNGAVQPHAWLLKNYGSNLLPTINTKKQDNTISSNSVKSWYESFTEPENSAYTQRSPREDYNDQYKLTPQSKIDPQQRQQDLTDSRNFLSSMYHFMWSIHDDMYKDAIFIKGTQDQDADGRVLLTEQGRWQDLVDDGNLVDENADSFLSAQQMQILSKIHNTGIPLNIPEQAAWFGHEFTFSEPAVISNPIPAVIKNAEFINAYALNVANSLTNNPTPAKTQIVSPLQKLDSTNKSSHTGDTTVSKVTSKSVTDIEKGSYYKAQPHSECLKDCPDDNTLLNTKCNLRPHNNNPVINLIQMVKPQ